MEFLVASIPLSSQAIYQRVLRIEGTGASAFATWAHRKLHEPDRDRKREELQATRFPASKRTSDQTMRVQIAVCLLCLSIVSGSLDTLPDPPAVAPQSNRNNLVSRLHYHVPVVAKNHPSDCLACAPHFQASLFSFGQIFERKGPSYDPNFVHQATDTSPPCLT
jgi:hypothetical protein